jgi:hypothetical protein
MYERSKPTLRSVKAELIEDSIERKKLVEKLIQLVREDEREKVLGITERARERAGER